MEKIQNKNIKKNFEQRQTECVLCTVHVGACAFRINYVDGIWKQYLKHKKKNKKLMIENKLLDNEWIITSKSIDFPTKIHQFQERKTMHRDRVYSCY